MFLSLPCNVLLGLSHTVDMQDPPCDMGLHYITIHYIPLHGLIHGIHA